MHNLFGRPGRLPLQIPVIILTILFFCVPFITSAAQVPPTITSAHTDAVVYAGPGDSFHQIRQLFAGLQVEIIERSRAGNWVHVQRLREDGSAIVDGWVMTGYLNLDPNLRFSQVPVNTTIADGDPANIPFLSVQPLYAAPVIPTVSPKMREVYELGQSLGNRANVVTKVGDSLSADVLYLGPLFSQNDYQLGPHDDLEETLRFFGPSLATISVASRIGMTTYVVFDPVWADKAFCLPRESPLDCEYRRKQPSIAFILFGPNDVRHMTYEEFGVQMRMIVEATLAKGIIPVLNTFSTDPNANLWWQSVDFNNTIIQVGAEYEVPVINLFVASRPLPAYGLERDAIHMKHSGWTNLKFDTGHETWYGTSLLNLLSLRMMDEIRRTVGMG
jgi:uncharacterized protein YraI